MTPLRHWAVAAGLGAGAATVGWRAWTRSLAFETGEHGQLAVPTRDGWTLGLYHYPARGHRRPVPVVAGHGFAGSRLLFDLGPDASFARWLAAAGFETFLLDLRGRGTSWPTGGRGPMLQWSFDDFLHQDLPAAVEVARDASGAAEVFWLGTEMSGQLAYAAALEGVEGLRGAVTFGAPAITPPDAEVPGITAPPRSRRRGRVPFRAGARAAGPVLARARSSLLDSSFRPENTEAVVAARYLFHGVPDESTVLADQFADWIDHATMRSLDGRVIWSDRLDAVDLPLLVVVGAADRQRPPDAVETTFRALGSPDKSFVRAGVAEGFSVDYGHDDLVAGRSSRSEVWPVVADWMAARS